MTWELQTHMIQYIEPSILAYVESLNINQQNWLACRYTDQRVRDDSNQLEYERLFRQAQELPADILIRAIAEHAAKLAATTNGGWEVYLCSWYSVPFCSDELMQSYWDGAAA